jgi:phosphatidate cytidylyltransferase
MIRLASGIALGTAALAAIWFLPVLGLRLFACAVAAAAAFEYLRLVSGDTRLLALVALVCWLVSIASPLEGLAMVTLLMVAVVVVSVLAAGHTVPRSSAAALSLAYIGLPLGMLVAVQASHGREATILLLATVVVSDSMQFYTGRLFGRHLLAPAISPKKTVEGAIGGVLFGALFMTLAGAWAFPDASRVSLAILGLATVVLGIAGDLFESAMKRHANVKDSSALIPGHGGVLDRIDALLFTVPTFYVFAGFA